MRAPSRNRGKLRVMIGGAVALTASLTLALSAVAAPPGGGTSGAPSPAASIPPQLAVEGDLTRGTLEATGATWTVRVPRLTGPLDPAILATIDAALATGAAADLAAFEASSSPPIDEAMAPDSYAEDFSVALLTSDVVSLRVLVSTYRSGAAHPGAALETWSFDLGSGQRLTLADLFSPGVDHLDAIATEARRALLDRSASEGSFRQWVKEGTQPNEANYSGWAMTPDGLEITFGQYQVAPYAEGMPVVVIGWSRLAGLLDPAGPAAVFLDGSGLPSPQPAPSMSPSAS